MSADSDQAIKRILGVLRQTYPAAQRTFVKVEVFEHLKSRRSIRELAGAFEDLSLAVTDADATDRIDIVEAQLSHLALEGMFYLCQVHWKDIAVIRSHPYLAACLLWRRPVSPEADKLILGALQDMDQGGDGERTIEDRVASYEQAFSGLLNATAKIRPHEFYDRAFAVVVGGIFALLGAIVGAIIY
jgi:hypothetical protein